MSQKSRPAIDKGARFTDWSRRPLDKRQIDYAVGDVTHLAKIFPMMLDKLVKTGRGHWLDEEMEKLADPAFPDHVIYRPQDLSAVPAAGLGILLWGNGGCMYDGASGRMHLLEVASHGYLAIAPGPINTGPGSPPKDQRIARRTTWQEVVAGLDQAIAANSDPSNALYGKLDLTKVAVAGHSCGGMQSLSAVLNDPRIKTAILHNSGLFRADMFNGGPVPASLEVIPLRR